MWASKEKLKSLAYDIFDMLSFLVFVGWIVFFFRFFVASPYNVVWASMAQTFQEGDFIVVDKISPQLNWRKRWDIIVFVPPGKDVAYIKRVIWLPWETVKVESWNVEICKDNKCKILDESTYLPSSTKTEAKCWMTEFEVTDWLFVMWDNRWFTTDSMCCFGLECYKWANYLVPTQNIIWKVYMRLIPHPTVF